MAEVRTEGDELVVVLSAFEKAESVHGDVRVPLSSVRRVEVLADAVDAVHGIKAPGSRWPGLFAVGTFYPVGTGAKTFAVVHHQNPGGVRIGLVGAAYDELVVGCADPEAVAALIPVRS